MCVLDSSLHKCSFTIFVSTLLCSAGMDASNTSLFTGLPWVCCLIDWAHFCSGVVVGHPVSDGAVVRWAGCLLVNFLLLSQPSAHLFCSFCAYYRVGSSSCAVGRINGCCRLLASPCTHQATHTSGPLHCCSFFQEYSSSTSTSSLSPFLQASAHMSVSQVGPPIPPT